jgi:hypothetical protein
MNILSLLQKLFVKPIDTGLREDPRSQEEKDKDYSNKERVLSGASIDESFSNKRITQSPIR